MGAWVTWDGFGHAISYSDGKTTKVVGSQYGGGEDEFTDWQNNVDFGSMSAQGPAGGANLGTSGAQKAGPPEYSSVGGGIGPDYSALAPYPNQGSSSSSGTDAPHPEHEDTSTNGYGGPATVIGRGGGGGGSGGGVGGGIGGSGRGGSSFGGTRPGGSGGGFGMPTSFGSAATGIGADYANAFNQATAANQNQYNSIMGLYGQMRSDYAGNAANIQQGYQQRYDRNMGMVNQLGGQQVNNARRQYAQFGAQQDQSMISRGLGNTTARTAVQSGVNSELANTLANINEGVIRQRTAADTALSGDSLNYQQRYNDQMLGIGQQQANFMNSVTNQYPNMQAYAQLAQGQGQAAAAQQAYNQQYAQMVQQQYLQNYYGGFGSGAGDYAGMMNASQYWY